MRTVILSLEDAVKTELKNIELLDKQDKVIFVYPKGKDSISIQVHTALTQLKCKVEFFEIPDENAVKQDMLMYFAYLAGSNSNSVVVDTTADLSKLTYLNIPRYQDFKSIIMKKVATRQPQEKTTRGRKASVKEENENPPVKKQKEDIQQTKPKSVKRTNPKTGSTPKNNTGMDELKEFLQVNATAEFNPASLTMGIYEAISQTVLEGTPIKEALKNVIIIDAKIDSLNHALQGKWNKIQDIVEKILKEKGKIS